MKTSEITNAQDVIDSRDVIARIEELTEEREALVESLKDSQEVYRESSDEDAIQEAQDEVEAKTDALSEWDEEFGQELKDLTTLAEEASGYADDWQYGGALIRDSYFAEYAEQLAEQLVNYDSRKVQWPMTCIDWEKAARELQMDYTAVEFGDVTYWIR